MNNYRIFLLFLFLIVFTACKTANQTEVLKLRQIYTEIEVENQYQIIANLESESIELREAAIEMVLTNPNDFIPPALYALSNTLFQKGEKDQAAFWFYVGQLRARYDANLCNDKSAVQIVAQLNDLYGLDINRETFKDIEKLKITIDKVIEYVKTNPENYDHRWISLHGSWLLDTSKTADIIEPKENWASIKEQTINSRSLST